MSASKELIHALKPMIILTKITGTQHFKFDEVTQIPMELKFRQKFFNVLIAIIMLCTSFWSLGGKFLHAYGYQLPVMVILNVLFHLSLTLGIFFQSILPLFTKTSIVNVIKTILETTDKIPLNCRRHHKIMRIMSVALLITFNIFALVFVLFDMTVWVTSFGIKIARYYLCDSIMLYKLTLHASQLFVCLALLQEKFKCINLLLPYAAKDQYYDMQTLVDIKCGRDAKTSPVTENNGTNKLNKPPSVRELSRLHEKLYQSCIEMNQFFGALIVIICFEVFVMMTQSVYCGVVFGIGLQKTLNTNFDSDLVIAVMACWTFYSLILVIFLTSLCDFTMHAANDTGIIAHKILLEDGLNQQTITELMRVAAQIQQQNLKFTASGLFGINLTTLLQLLGAVSSYIIVAFQFEGMTPSEVPTPESMFNSTIIDTLINI